MKLLVMHLFQLSRYLVICASFIFTIPCLEFSDYLVFSSHAIAADKPAPKARERAVRKPVKRERTPRPKREVPTARARGEARAVAKPEAATAAKLPQSADSVDAVLLLDSSGSMQRNNAAELRNQGALLFARFLNPGDRLAIIEFDRNARTVLEFTEINDENLPKIESAITKISVTGTHTDFEMPLRKAFDLFYASEQKNPKRVVALLSDGKMDPHPERGTAQVLTDLMLSFDLPLLSRNSIRVFTFSLTPETDQQLLGSIAQGGNGEHWYTPEVNKLHRGFSELFLSLKKPHADVHNAEGFSVKADTSEVTFYIERKSADESVGVIDPSATVITNTSIPANVKWFRGDLFDIVTVQNPKPGIWGIDTRKCPSAVTTFLRDIRLEVRSPGGEVVAGDTIYIPARLVDTRTSVGLRGIEQASYINLQIFEQTSGRKVLEQLLRDDGTEGDDIATDRVYTAAAQIEKEGDYQAVVTAVTPTFTRVANFSFQAGHGLLSISEKIGNPELGIPTLLNVRLNRRALALEQPQVVVQLQKEGAKELQKIAIDTKKGLTEQLVASTKGLSEGVYQATATITGTDSKGETITSASMPQKITVVADNTVPKVEVAEVPAEEKKIIVPETEPVWPEIVSLVLSVFWAGGMYVFVKRKYSVEIVEDVPLEKFELPGHIARQIQALKEKSGTQKRPLTEAEREVFALGNELPSAEESAVLELTAESVSELVDEEIQALLESVQGEAESAIAEDAGLGAEAEITSEAGDEASIENLDMTESLGEEAVAGVEEATAAVEEVAEPSDAVTAEAAQETASAGSSDEELAAIDELIKEINAQG